MAWGLISHTADVGFWARAKGEESLFLETFKAFESLLTSIRRVVPKERCFFVFREQGLEELLHTALSELLYVFDTQRLLFSRFVVLRLNRENLELLAFGEPHDPKRHPILTIPKAVTYHNFSIQKEPRGLMRVEVILDA